MHGELSHAGPNVDRAYALAEDPNATELLYDEGGRAYHVPIDWLAGLISPADFPGDEILGDHGNYHGHSADDADHWPPGEDTLDIWGLDPFAD